MPTYDGARAQRALMDRAAEIQKKRDADLAAKQADAAAANAEQQKSVMGAQAGYNAQATQQQAGIQTQRDQTQFGYQAQANQQQADIQKQRDQLLIQNQQERDAQARQHESAMQEQHVQGQMAVFNNQLSQGEQLRLQRLKQGVASTDEAVQNGTLTPEEGRQMRVQLQTGIDPLQRRLVQSNIDNERARTQAVTQQTVQGATEFNRRQNILAQSAQDRMHIVTDPVTGMQTMYQMDPDGSMKPVDFPRQNMELFLHAHDVGSRAALSEAQRGAVELNSEHLRQTHPLLVEQLRNQVAQGPEAFRNEQDFMRARTALSRYDVEERQTTMPYRNANMQANTALQAAQAQDIGNTFQARNANMQANTALNAAQTARLNQDIKDHPLMRDLASQVTQGNITHQTLENVYSALRNVTAARDLANGVSPRVRAASVAHHETDLRNEMLGAGRFLNTPAAARFKYSEAPSGETPTQKTEREQREFNAEVRRRSDTALGVSSNGGEVDQQSWNTVNGAVRQSVAAQVASGSLRVPQGANRDAFINEESDRQTANHLGMQAAEPLPTDWRSAANLTAPQRARVDAYRTLQRRLTEQFGELNANNTQGRLAHQLLDQAMAITARWGSVESMPPRERAEYTRLRSELESMNLANHPNVAAPADQPWREPARRGPAAAAPQQQQPARGGLMIGNVPVENPFVLPPGPWNDWNRRP